MSDNPWTRISECFDTDDGSLPSIEIVNLSPAGVASVYAMLRRRSRLSGEAPEFWSRLEEVSVSADSVPNAAALVAGEQAEPFHFCISGLISDEVELPELGVFVWPDAVELDYRMGPEWTTDRIAGFFGLLRDCCRLDPGAVVKPAEMEGPPFPDLFAQVWQSYANGNI